MNPDEIQRITEKILLKLQDLKKDLEKTTQEDVYTYSHTYTFDSEITEIQKMIDALEAKKKENLDIIKNKEDLKKQYPLVPMDEILTPEERTEIAATDELFKNSLTSVLSLKQEVDKLYDEFKIKVENIKRNKEEQQKQEKQEKARAKIQEEISNPSEKSKLGIYYEDLSFVDIEYQEQVLDHSTRVLPKYLVDASEDIGLNTYLARNVRQKVYTRFIPYEGCSPEQKQAIKEKEEQLKDILESKKRKYTKKGIARIGDVEIETTPEELARAGLLYTDYEWKKTRGRTSSKEIADTSKALTSQKVSKAGNFISRLLNRTNDKNR